MPVAGDPTRAGSARAVRALPSSPSAIAAAREFVVATLRGWRVEPGAVDDSELVVSELVTNAFVHGGADAVEVVVDDVGEVVRVQVAHREAGPSSEPLTPLTVTADETHGRGLAIVDVLARRWGVDEDGDERRVWADLVASRTDGLGGADREAATAELLARLTDAADTHAVGDAVTAWGRGRLAAAFTGVALVDADPAFLRYLSVEPLPEQTAIAWARFAVAVDAPVAAAYRDDQPYFHESRSAAVAQFPGLGPTLEASQVSALAHLPLHGTHGVLGTLAFAWSHGRELSSDDRTWLVDVAAATAGALVRVGGTVRS